MNIKRQCLTIEQIPESQKLKTNFKSASWRTISSRNI